MKRIACSALALLLLAATPGPSPVVGGSVRDQRGAAIEGARITLYERGRPVGVTTSGADGTFAFAGVVADSVGITCDFCEASRKTLGVDGTAVAIMHRYDAVRRDGPTAEDVRHLPYGSPESLFSLTPFVVLSDSSRTLPGPQLTDRRRSNHGGLFTIDGVPAYDITANTPLYSTIPLFDVADVTVLPSSDAYLYGDVADAGTFALDTPNADSRAIVGASNAVHIAQSTANTTASFAYSSGEGNDRRLRADASAQSSMRGWTATSTVGSGRGDIVAANTALTSAFSSAALSIAHDTGLDVAGSLAFDQGSYDYRSARFPAQDAWSDIDAGIALHSHANVAPFLLLRTQRSDAEVGLTQSRGVVGVSADATHLHALVALGDDVVSYGQYAAFPGLHESVQDAVASATWSPTKYLGVEASAQRGYTLPTFEIAYAPNAASTTIPRNSSIESTVSFTDAHRIRFALTALHFAGLSTQGGSVGASLAWQATPLVSIRAWVLRNADTALNSASVGSIWATYDTGAFRIDAILRRDILDNRPDAHLDGSISGALGAHATWFAGTDVRRGVRGTDVGIRW